MSTHRWNNFSKSLKEAIKAIGIVFGDIGTSPIYTLTVIFALIPVSTQNVFGVLSLIVWTLIALVTVQYAWLAMSLSQRGEGGTIVLREILIPLIHSKKARIFYSLLTFVGISFLIGDGVITPAISILAAVEGLPLIPTFANISNQALLVIASIICIVLFAFQSKGTERVSVIFGPIMVIWFFALGFVGILWIMHDASVIYAINPKYAIDFIIANKLSGFLILSKVILCATGGEALYADMGHLGRIPIIRGWFFALFVLIISYLGQGAYILHNPESKNSFYDMIFSLAPSLSLPFLLLSIFATVIASQAMISGLFSIVYQGITTNIMPKMKVEYTSHKLRSQIYIPAINWFLLACVLLAIFKFKLSINLANAYGLAATCTMTITSLMMITIFFLREEYFKFFIATFVGFLNFNFLLASTSKIYVGGYISILIALIPLSLTLLYTSGKKRLKIAIAPTGMQQFVQDYKAVYKKAHLIEGTALFFSRSVRRVPTYIVQTILTNNIIYEENIIVSVVTKDRPFGIHTAFTEELAPGLRVFEISMGYMEIMNIENILEKSGIQPKAIFYGMEEIKAKNIIWKLYAFIKKISPSFVEFYKLPSNKVHGVMIRVEL